MVIVAVAALACTIAALVLGLFHRSASNVLTEVFAPVRDGLANAVTAIDRTSGRLGARAEIELRGLGLRRFTGAHLAGAILFTAIFAAVAPLEYVQFTMMASALGLGEAAIPKPLEWLDPTLLTGASALLVAVASGLVVRELLSRKGRLLPIERMTRAERWLSGELAVACLCGVSWVVYTGGPFRAEALLSVTPAVAETSGDTLLSESLSFAGDGAATATTQPVPAALSHADEPSPVERRAALATLTILPLCLAVVALESFHFGPELVVATAPAGVLKAGQGSLFAIARLLQTARWLVLLLWGVLISAQEWLARIGITFLRGAIARARDRVARASRPGVRDRRRARAVRAGSAWSLDVELPDAPVGNVRRLQDAGGASPTVAAPTPEVPEVDTETEATPPGRGWDPFGR